MSKFKRCPCGEIPEVIAVGVGRFKMYSADGRCCGVWFIKFDHKPGADVFNEAAEAWNAAPKGDV